MNCREPLCENNKNFKLTGSQINLTSRSDQTVLGSCARNRPCSAAHSCKCRFGDKTDYIRPKSAECRSLNSSKFESHQWHFYPAQKKLSGDTSVNTSVNVSQFTDSSSKLLQNLIETSNHVPTAIDASGSISERYSKRSDYLGTEGLTKAKHLKSESSLEFFGKNHEVFEDSTGVLKEHSCSSEQIEEKTVRFSEELPLDFTTEKKFSEKCTYMRDNENLYSCLKNKLKPPSEEIHTKRISSDKRKESQSPETNSPVPQTNNVLKIFLSHLESKPLNNLEQKEQEVFHEKWDNSAPQSGSEKLEKNYEIPEKISISTTSDSNSDVEPDNKTEEKIEKMTEIDETKEENLQVKHDKDEDDIIHKKIDLMESTYEEIVQLLKTIDDEDTESVNMEYKQDSSVENSMAEIFPKDKVDYFTEVSSYLEEMERNNDTIQENFVNTEKKWSSKHFTSPRLEELLNKNSAELAHEVFSLKIQIEDQKKGIKLLKDTLSEMKEAKKVVEIEHQEALRKVTSEAESLVQRHQKFIKQLLNEKKNLNETVSKLVQDLKSGEERYKKNIKAMEEKHLIEVKRAKEAQAVADKIRREKWMETKTQKIKEMTVKGLEPELSRMAARQQEELNELRNLHKAELEAIELRAARRSSELMDELRAELTKEKERAIAKETAMLRATMEKDFEDERNKFQQFQQNLKDRIRKLEEKLSNQEFEFQQRLLEFKQEEEKRKQKLLREHEENLAEVRRQHLVEIRNLKESAETEKEMALNNFKKLQAVKFTEREAELHQQYKKERDQEIEMIIETLEKESSQAQLELSKANENKLKRLKDKMEAEIKEIEASESALKEKLTETKTKLSEKEDTIMELNTQIRQLQTELTILKKSCEEMSSERARIKEIIRGEFETSINGFAKEKENHEKDMTLLKENHAKELAKKDQQNVQIKYEMQKELTRVYSRIKMAVNKKEKIIESLREENEAANQRCRQLEFMLDQQRRNLLLQCFSGPSWYSIEEKEYVVAS